MEEGDEGDSWKILELAYFFCFLVIIENSPIETRSRFVAKMFIAFLQWLVY